MADDHAAQRDDRRVGGASADIDDHAAVGIKDGQAAAQRRGEGLFHQQDLSASGVLGGLAHGAALDGGDGAG